MTDKAISANINQLSGFFYAQARLNAPWLIMGGALAGWLLVSFV